MKVNCCSICFESLARVNTTHARIWVDLCMKCAVSGGYIFVQEVMSPKLVPVFRSLEKQRFISSCDLNECVALRAEGHILIEDDEEIVDGYCIDLVSHFAAEFGEDG